MSDATAQTKSVLLLVAERCFDTNGNLGVISGIPTMSLRKMQTIVFVPSVTNGFPDEMFVYDTKNPVVYRYPNSQFTS